MESTFYLDEEVSADDKVRDQMLFASAHAEYCPHLEVLHEYNAKIEQDKKEEQERMANSGKRKPSKKKQARKKKAPTIKNYFTHSTKSATKMKPAKNFQGFAMSQCWHSEKAGCHVFIPSGDEIYYDQFGTKVEPSPRWQASFCLGCMQSPCLVDWHEHHIRETANDLVFSRFPEHPTMKEFNEASRDWAFDLFKNQFGEKYAKKVGEPVCCRVKIGRIFPRTNSHHNEDDSEDETEWTLEGIASFRG